MVAARRFGLVCKATLEFVDQAFNLFAMWTLIPILLFAVVVVAIGGLWVVLLYNRLVRQRNGLREAWSGIEVQLKRRHDLVPNLVKCVAAYQRHERELLEAVTEHRAQAAASIIAAGDDLKTETGGAENELGRDIGKLVMLAEAYPELKADRQFLSLGKELIEIEDDLQYARRYYNGTARDLNNLVESFPGTFIAQPLGFRRADFFEVTSVSERIAPEIAQLLK